MGNYEKVILIFRPFRQQCPRSSECALAHSKNKSSSMILNEMIQDSAADSLDRCMLGDLCARPLAGPREQILTVYFFKLKATGRLQFLYFWTLDKLNPTRCQHTWQGAIFLTYPSPMLEIGENLIAGIIDLLFFSPGVYTQQGHFNYMGTFQLLLLSEQHQDTSPTVDRWETSTFLIFEYYSSHLCCFSVFV